MAGSLLLHFAGGRFIFALPGLGALVLLAGAFAVDESAPEGGHHRLDPRGLAASYTAVLRHRGFRDHALVYALGSGAGP